MRRELEFDDGIVRQWAVFNDAGEPVGTDVEAVPQLLTADEQTLADYEANLAPTAAQTAAALKALIRLR